MLTQRVLNVIVSDVCEPIPFESISCSKYFVTFIGVHPQYSEITLMQQKSEVGLQLIEYLGKIQNHFGVFPLILCTNRS